MPRHAIAARLRLEPFWNDEFAVDIVLSPLPVAPRHDSALTEFMTTECNFAMEHADGSFMDHLQFCYEYSHEHFKGESPRVLLLHSILGVGSNYFPCDKSKIPKLQSLLTEAEFSHVAAFPSVLRLLLQRDFMDELEQMSNEKLETIKGLKMHQVIDNEPTSLTSKNDFWTHLNYQIIHLLDFLPVLDWQWAVAQDNFMANFVRLLAFLKRANKLKATIDLDFTTVNTIKTPDGKSILANVSLGGLIKNYVPAKIQQKLASQQVSKFSKEIGHSLEYTILYDTDEAE